MLPPSSLQIYPLPLAPCTAADTATWSHVPATSEIVQVSTGNCLDLAHESALLIGTFECGSGSGLLQSNQQWALDSSSGVIISLMPGGGCMTALPA